MGIRCESEVFDSPANPNKEIPVNNFQFTKATGIMFVQEMDGDYVFNLLWEKINEKPFSKSTEETSSSGVLTKTH